VRVPVCERDCVELGVAGCVRVPELLGDPDWLALPLLDTVCDRVRDTDCEAEPVLLGVAELLPDPDGERVGDGEAV
jgi:hypothetical protein